MLTSRDVAANIQLSSCPGQRLDEYLSVMVPRRLQVFQLAAGGFEGSSAVLTAPGFRFLRCSSTQPLLLSWVQSNELMLAFPLHQRHLFAMGRRWTSEQQLTVPGGSEIAMWTPEWNDMLLLVLSHDLLRSCLGAGDARVLVESAAMQRNRLQVSGKAEFTAAMLGLFRRLCLNASDESEAGCMQAFSELLNLLYGYVTAPVPAEQTSVQDNHERIVQLAMARLLAAPGADHGLDDLCSAAHCSRRTLASAFQEIVGLPPVRFARKMRLNAFRRELLRSGSPQELSIVMSAFGYTNHGRLNAEYRRLFGESPLDTLRQPAKSQTLRVHPYDAATAQ